LGERPRSPGAIEARFTAQVQEAQAGKAARKKTAAAPDFTQLDAVTKVELLSPLYAKNLGAEPKYPDASPALNQARAGGSQSGLS